jgi:hypothetical protein
MIIGGAVVGLTISVTGGVVVGAGDVGGTNGGSVGIKDIVFVSKISMMSNAVSFGSEPPPRKTRFPTTAAPRN